MTKSREEIYVFINISSFYRLQIINGMGESDYEVVPVSGADIYTYLDTTAMVGERKEYRIVSYRVAGGQSAYGHAVGGYALPLIDDRGGVVLLVDAAQSAPLSEELTRLDYDLRGDGWRQGMAARRWMRRRRVASTSISTM